MQPDGHPDPLMGEMGLNAEASHPQWATLFFTFTGEVYLQVSHQAAPKVRNLIILGLKARKNGPVAIKDLEYFRENVRREFPPLLTRRSRTAAVGVDESSGLELEVRNSFSVGEIDDFG